MAASILLLVAGSWLALESLRLRRERLALEGERAALQARVQALERQAAEQQQLRQLPEEAELPDEAALPPGSEGAQQAQGARRTVTFVLMAGLLRDLSGSSRLVIPANADQVRLEVPLEQDEYESYQVLIERVTGERIWSADRLPIRPGKVGQAVVVTLPPNLLPPGHYIVRLRGHSGTNEVRSVNDYSFRIAKS